MDNEIVTYDEIRNLYEKLSKEAESGGYHLNTDKDFTYELIKALIINKERYGYFACPCRLASGKKEDDIDIICPCDYRDPDLDDYEACYCALYVSKEILDGTKKAKPIPERRLPAEERKKEIKQNTDSKITNLPLPVWRCKVCGYLCARDSPPAVCPICKVKRERFERFI